MKPLIYVAGPYTQGDPVLNTRKALEVGEKVYEVGGVPLVPHLSHLWHLVAPKDYRFWMDLDMDYLDHCHALFRITGHSPGADEEVQKMLKEGKPVFLELDGYEELQHYVESFKGRSEIRYREGAYGLNTP